LRASISCGPSPAPADAEVIQEIAYRFHAVRRRAEGLKLAEAFLSVVEAVLPVTRREIARSLLSTGATRLSLPALSRNSSARLT